MNAAQELTPLERAVMEKFLERNDPCVPALRAQLRAAVVRKREFTGAGFFTYFSGTAQTRERCGDVSFNWTDVLAKIPQLKNPAGFALFVERGELHFLEGYTCGDETWPDHITTFEVRRA
jgi:hypothetical protein